MNLKHLQKNKRCQNIIIILITFLFIKFCKENFFLWRMIPYKYDNRKNKKWMGDFNMEKD
jgi:hypothetical protein